MVEPITFTSHPARLVNGRWVHEFVRETPPLHHYDGFTFTGLPSHLLDKLSGMDTLMGSTGAAFVQELISTRTRRG